MGTCFECETNFELDEGVGIGDTVTCPKCATRFEVVSMDSSAVTLDYSTEEEED